jgi:deoxyribodipyrimidine photo-lyase
MAVFLFHRDLRIVDHNGLHFAKENYKTILPLFVFTPEQVSDKNKLRSVNSIQFMIASLKELEGEIRKQGGKLFVAYGDTVEVLKKIKQTFQIEAIVETADYTPYAKKRSEDILKFTEKEGLKYHPIHDSYLLEPGTIKNGTGKTFQKFTPFYNSALKHKIPAPRHAEQFSWIRPSSGKKGTRKIRRSSWETTLDAMEDKFVSTPNPDIAVKGGREEGLKLIKNIPDSYAKTHDIPSINTSFLSAHNHYGTVSIREVYAQAHKPGSVRYREVYAQAHKPGSVRYREVYAQAHKPGSVRYREPSEVQEGGKGNTAFIRQLWWRDFYGNIMADFETLYKVGAYEFQKKEYEHPLTDSKKDLFEKWCKGETGVRLVDAGMKQMLKTGYMHNRLRLVVASWLTKDMKIHWRHGERFFAKHLVDYDATQNMMNWIWVASELPFASAPFRKVSAEGTAQKFDPDEVYVKEWLGEK